METPVKYMCILVFVVSMTIAGFNGVDGTSNYYGPCGKHDIEKEAQKLAPCTYAAKYFRAPVSERCCTIMEKKLNNPSCLCAILQSRTAYNAGVRPEVAVTIPKRCNIAVRPVGHKCGGTSCIIFIAALSRLFKTTPIVHLPALHYSILAVQVCRVLSKLLVDIVGKASL
ncbi:hypothetical protein Gotri_004922 [Gossypium trilobum]|uniref:Bifunctional inhibitor/plant lipid transfer protein/seed storage helical domain-containing protein n=1 Tax=Gossypium trilobum TaxID=34281 RepID=A0A7J9F6F6_9ROSI|nr:hypothetical protein [Gossypium trilobum]